MEVFESPVLSNDRISAYYSPFSSPKNMVVALNRFTNGKAAPVIETPVEKNPPSPFADGLRLCPAYV